MTRGIQRRSVKVSVAIAVALFLAGVIAWSNWSLREQMRAQVLAREGRTLIALVDLQRTLEAERLRESGVDPAALDEWMVALQTTRLAGVVALRLYADGVPQLVLPAGVIEAPLAAADRASAARRVPVVRFHRSFSPEALFNLAVDDAAVRADCLEVIVPVSAPDGPLSVAQYWIDGAPVTAEFAALDAQIGRRAFGVWAIATLLALGILAWAARRLEMAMRALARADQELTMAAKSSALGAVTAHLMHGLRNSIGALRTITHEPATKNVGAEELRAALAEAGRTSAHLHAMVREVTELLHDEAHDLRYEITTRELWAGVEARVGASLAARLNPKWEGAESVALERRTAGLVSLVLVNLVQNACEASPAGAKVDVVWRTEGGRVAIDVVDRGPGLPAEVRERLFSPVTSTREGGAGIGLAISRRLAAHADGALELLRSDASGTAFRVTAPSCFRLSDRTDRAGI